MENVIFELGKIYLKTELSKVNSENVIKAGYDSNEKIISQKVCKYWNQYNMFDRPDGLAVFTNRRFVFIAGATSIQSNLTTTTEMLSFPYDYIINPISSKVWFFIPCLNFGANDSYFSFTFLSGGVDNLISIIKDNR